MPRKGGFLETRLAVRHRAYQEAGLAWVVAAHPGTKVVRGQVLHTSKGPPDFVGCIDGGQTVCFDAKETSQDRWPFDKLKLHQAMHLEAVWARGGLAFLVVCWKKHRRFAVVPWSLLRGPWFAWSSKDAESSAASLHLVDPIIIPIDDADWLGAVLEHKEVFIESPPEGGQVGPGSV